MRNLVVVLSTVIITIRATPPRDAHAKRGDILSQESRRERVDLFFLSSQHRRSVHREFRVEFHLVQFSRAISATRRFCDDCIDALYTTRASSSKVVVVSLARAKGGGGGRNGRRRSAQSLLWAFPTRQKRVFLVRLFLREKRPPFPSSFDALYYAQRETTTTADKDHRDNATNVSSRENTKRKKSD